MEIQSQAVKTMLRFVEDFRKIDRLNANINSPYNCVYVQFNPCAVEFDFEDSPKSKNISGNYEGCIMTRTAGHIEEPTLYYRLRGEGANHIFEHGMIMQTESNMEIKVPFRVANHSTDFDSFGDFAASFISRCITSINYCVCQSDLKSSSDLPRQARYLVDYGLESLGLIDKVVFVHDLIHLLWHKKWRVYVVGQSNYEQRFLDQWAKSRFFEKMYTKGMSNHELLSQATLTFLE